ncbi:MAG TPA: YidC/Oxa1 family membrane protein insertase, partial [Acidimicrobiales bacterium]|nr:YidC/Oxa1 family membrane protein insertase [Acidimicrobiales bacterium]
ANIGGTFWDKLPYFILLLVMVGTQYYQQRQLTARNPQAAQGQQQQIMKFIPLFFGLISIRFPAGVVLYWTTSNGIRIFQQWAMYRWDPKVKALVVQDVKAVEAKTREIDEQERKSPPTRPRLRDLLAGAAGNAAGQGGNKPSSSGKPSSGNKPPARGKPPSRARPSSGTRTGQGSGRGTTGKPIRSSTPRPAPAKPIAKGNLNGRADEGADAVPPKPTRQRNADGGPDAGPSKPGPSNAGPPDAGPPDAGPPDAGSPSAVPPKPATGRTPNGSGGSRTGAGSARSRSKRARRGR